MIPLVDIHCHLLAGMDDGPRTSADVLDMCRLACAEGVRLAAATAHQNECWPAVTPERIRTATAALSAQLQSEGVPLTVFPCAEVMVEVDTEAAWQDGRLLSIADRGEYLLIEMPHGLFVDVRDIVRSLREQGVHPILAHPERHPEFLEEPGRMEELIQEGCLVQVSTGSVTDPRSRQERKALRSWFRRGVVHLMGSDGHSPHRRPPLMAAAYREVCSWAGPALADRVFSTNGTAVLTGLPLRVPKPDPQPAGWFAAWW